MNHLFNRIALAALLSGGAVACGDQDGQLSGTMAGAGAPLTFTWKLHERASQYRAAYSWKTRTYDDAYVHPKTFVADLDACGSSGLPADAKLTWVVAPKGAGAVAYPNKSCRITVTLAGAREFDVSVTQPAKNRTGAQKLVPRDLLVVGLGDSLAAGQGNPSYLDPRCNLTKNSHQYRYAQQLEADDDHTTVTFVSYACSGATVADVDLKSQRPAETFCFATADVENGKLLPYGLVKADGYAGDPGQWCFTLPEIRPQLAALKAAIGSRFADTVLINVGVNDVGFAEELSKCAGPGECGDPGHLPTMKKRVDSLQPKLLRVARGLARDFEFGDVYQTGYPDVIFERHGSASITGLTGCGAFDFGGRMSSEEIAWFKDVASSMNEVIGGVVTQNGWNFVPMGERFLGHDYCAGSKSWFVPWHSSVLNQFDMEGTMHPDDRGQAEYAAAVWEAARHPVPRKSWRVGLELLSYDTNQGLAGALERLSVSSNGQAVRVDYPQRGYHEVSGLTWTYVTRARREYVRAIMNLRGNPVPCELEIEEPVMPGDGVGPAHPKHPPKPPVMGLCDDNKTALPERSFVLAPGVVDLDLGWVSGNEYLKAKVRVTVTDDFPLMTHLPGHGPITLPPGIGHH